MERRPWASVTLTGLDDTPTLTPTLGTTTTSGAGRVVVVWDPGAEVGEMILREKGTLGSARRLRGRVTLCL